MSLRAIQKRDRNKLSLSQQKQHHPVNKNRTFVVPIGTGSSSVGASATGSGHGNHHHHHHHHHHQPQQPNNSRNEKWRNSSSASISSSATISDLTHKKRSVSYPSLQQKSSSSSTHPSSLRFTKSESNLNDTSTSGGGGRGAPAIGDASDQANNFSSSNNLYLGAKSEVCLKTLAVKSTHQPPAPFFHHSSAGSVGNRQRMYESSRRTSEIVGSELGRIEKFAAIGNNVTAVRIPIIGYEVMEERARFTIFKLRIENSISHTCWLVLRRYTDFVRLNNKLRALFPHCNLVLPRKKWFGDNFSTGFIDNRIQGLQTFINTILGDESMRTCPVVREFFCLDEPPTYSESMEESRIIFEAQEETISHLKQQLQTKDELIAALQAKLSNEINRSKMLTTVIRNSFENCSKCAKQLDNHLKDSPYK
ncbi:uncharacterized protein LOC129764965 [Toxorhynchites rutilus septentrionalis]|uniref:uncharacterized protein LOC129764965 n=1 Tax=Toxorhynchites rutilus septentrionalis TaxID=329112 RepID=UPI00247A0C1C|nr:uncharacterized protein LOC129764965 [Toxorhynchites rutilus septentrionalis]